MNSKKIMGPVDKLNTNSVDLHIPSTLAPDSMVYPYRTHSKSQESSIKVPLKNPTTANPSFGEKNDGFFQSIHDSEKKKTLTHTSGVENPTSLPLNHVFRNSKNQSTPIQRQRSSWYSVQSKNEADRKHKDINLNHRMCKQVERSDKSSQTFLGKNRIKTTSTTYHSVPMQLCRTKFCPFKLKGDCLHNESCSYAHSKEQLRPLPDLHKTKLCEAVKRGAVCMKKDCSYAHSFVELRLSSDLVTYKTSLCFFWRKGRCLNLSKCRFAHGIDDLRVKPATNHLDFTAQKTRPGKFSCGSRGPTLEAPCDSSTDVLTGCTTPDSYALEAGQCVPERLDDVILRSSDLLRQKEIGVTKGPPPNSYQNLDSFTKAYEDFICEFEKLFKYLICPDTFSLATQNPNLVIRLDSTVATQTGPWTSTHNDLWTSEDPNESVKMWRSIGKMEKADFSRFDVNTYVTQDDSGAVYEPDPCLLQVDWSSKAKDYAETRVLDLNQASYNRSVSLLSTQPTLTDGMEDSSKSDCSSFPIVYHITEIDQLSYQVIINHLHQEIESLLLNALEIPGFHDLCGNYAIIFTLGPSGYSVSKDSVLSYGFLQRLGVENPTHFHQAMSWWLR